MQTIGLLIVLIGISMADSACLVIPFALVAAGALLMLKGARG